MRFVVTTIAVVCFWPALASADAGIDAAIDAGGELFLPGTQPGDLTQPLREPSVCEACHGGFADFAANDSWKGTMMSNAARDPLFQAALTVANQDIPGSGDLCLRCHTPRGWLFGRSKPPKIETLVAADFESVDCDFCHRLVTAEDESAYVGNGQYLVADDFVRRGPIADPKAPHDAEYSTYLEESRLCGLCHDVSSPFQNGFPIERTYTEWLSSAFVDEGTTCQTCHMPKTRGPSCGAPNMPDRDVHRHDLAGGNTWMPRVLSGEFPGLGRAEAFERTIRNAEAQLNRAATVSISAPELALAGQGVEFSVRVENNTGHKLPTGYPEGRRAWLEVSVMDARGRNLLHSGKYDVVEARRIEDDALRTYEVRLAAKGTEGFHFVLQDEVLQDNRIPPRGFVANSQTRPKGREYAVIDTTGAGDVLAHWDEAPYSFSIPDDARGPLTVTASLWYQTTSGEYVRALRDANTTDTAGKRMYDLWEKYDRAPPFQMTQAETRIEIGVASPADAGGDVVEAGASEAGMDVAVVDDAAQDEAGRIEAGFPDASADAADRDVAVDAAAPSGGSRNSGGGCIVALPVRVGGSTSTRSVCLALLLCSLAIRRRNKQSCQN